VRRLTASAQVPGKISHIISTGNLCSKVSRGHKEYVFFFSFLFRRERLLMRCDCAAQEVFDYLKTIANDVHVVKGEFDDSTLSYPENKVVTVGAFRIGVTHGHQVVPWGDKVRPRTAPAQRTPTDARTSSGGARAAAAAVGCRHFGHRTHAPV
jgi:predicted phosphodiesterase